GSAPFLVDDHRVLALHTSTPLWRDLGVGSRGDDVRAVQEELTRLGHEVEATGYYGAGTAAAMSQVWVDATGEEKVTSLALSRVVWLPDREVVAAGCPLQVGRSVAAGEVAVVAGGGLTSLALDLEAPQDDGHLVAVVADDVTTPVP